MSGGRNLKIKVNEFPKGTKIKNFLTIIVYYPRISTNVTEILYKSERGKYNEDST
jgi:hypothetical protein